MKDDPTSIALAYIEGCGRKDLRTVESLLAPNLTFVGPGNSVTGAAAYMAVLRRLGPVWVSSEIRKVFTDGTDVCVVYDFVTNTAAGKVPIVEWLRIENGRVAAVMLIFDRVSFKPAADELARRAAG
jgi:hypothetical protein